mgnify:CR=1 FL=1
MSREFLNLDEVADWLGRDRRTVEKLVQRGILPGRRIAGEWRFHPAEITHWAEQDLRTLDATELANFQHDMLAGMPRPQALRQLARRVDLPALTGFTSALIQAETVGASFAETLQYQAVELRSRRRENALLQAQSLPVKLVFPLVICFLPGIFASTLAPVLFQVVQVADGVLRGAGR